MKDKGDGGTKMGIINYLIYTNPKAIPQFQIDIFNYFSYSSNHLSSR